METDFSFVAKQPKQDNNTENNSINKINKFGISAKGKLKLHSDIKEKEDDKINAR